MESEFWERQKAVKMLTRCVMNFCSIIHEKNDDRTINVNKKYYILSSLPDF